MGSLTSRPKIPQVQQQPVIITVPAAPVASSVPASTVQTQQSAQSASGGSSAVNTSTAADTGTPAEGTSNEEAQRLAREDNLLRRGRGRLSTVLTGFSGLLSQAASASGRKTLLGE